MQTSGGRFSAALKTPPILVGLLVLACSRTPHAPPQSDAVVEIPDAALMEYASRSYDKGSSWHRHVVLGKNHGVQVVADFPCSDLCPDHTVRIIHYDVPLSICSDVGGVERTIMVPIGIAAGPDNDCFPKVLADNWDRYVR
jgi:hypothetical protein